MAKRATKTAETEVKQDRKPTKAEEAVAGKLQALYRLQYYDSLVDKIRNRRGELPLEVEDLEDEVAGLETRLNRLTESLAEAEQFVKDKQNFIKDAKASIKKYEAQQSKVRNNREFDSLSKEIEFQNLEIQLAEKRIKEGKVTIENKQGVVEESRKRYEERKEDLIAKKKELDAIVSETEKEEKALAKKSDTAAQEVEERLLKAYRRVRGGARNGLAVVHMERGSCGGCFNAIPPQRQLDIASHKKIIVCEHCGRILVDESIVEAVSGENGKN